jgi:hypothetical protein
MITNSASDWIMDVFPGVENGEIDPNSPLGKVIETATYSVEFFATACDDTYEGAVIKNRKFEGELTSDILDDTFKVIYSISIRGCSAIVRGILKEDING